MLLTRCVSVARKLLNLDFDRFGFRESLSRISRSAQVGVESLPGLKVRPVRPAIQEDFTARGAGAEYRGPKEGPFTSMSRVSHWEGVGLRCCNSTFYNQFRTRSTSSLICSSEPGSRFTGDGLPLVDDFYSWVVKAFRDESFDEGLPDFPDAGVFCKCVSEFLTGHAIRR